MASSLLTALLRVDPTQGLVDYIQTVKPYHTKLLDILVEYVYTDSVNVTITDSLAWYIEFLRPNVDTVYSCGYGLIWDQSPTTESNIVAEIISAAGPDATVDGNSFLFQPVVGASYQIAMINETASLFSFVSSHSVLNVNFNYQQWTITGDISTSLSVGSLFYISSNSTPNANGKYTVAAISVISGNTVITTVETIYPLATNTGIINVPVPYEDMPVWVGGTQLQVQSSNTLPSPLITSEHVYFAPSTTPNVFNLSYVRFPVKYTDFVHITNPATGILTANRSETFPPGATVVVSGSHRPANNKLYTISSYKAEGNYIRAFVYETVPYSSPTNVSNDGMMTYQLAGYDGPGYCPVAESSDVQVNAYIDDSIAFHFEFVFNDKVNATVTEFNPAGYGNTVYSTGNDSPYGTSVDGGSNVIPSTLVGTIVPTGIDGQLFDIGEFDENIITLQLNNPTP